MKNIFLYLFVFVLVSCGESTNPDSTDENSTPDVKTALEDRAKIIDDIAYLESDLSSSPDDKMDPKLAKQLIEKSELYATTYKDDPKSPNYLFRAGDIAKGIGMPEKAIELWEILKVNYPEHEKAPPATFLQGFTYENDLNNYEKAKEVYNEFLQKYPDHGLAINVRSVLKNLGVPPEELVKSFQKK